MSTLQTRSFSAIVESIAAGMQGRINAFLNFAVGTWLRGLAEAYAGVSLWLQKLALDIQKLTRLATSQGDDIDSFIADFPLSGVTRLGAQAATGLVTFGRYTAGSATVVVPVGTQVKTGDGTQMFVVYADTTNPAYLASYTPAGAVLATGGYVMPPQVASVQAPVVAAVAGSAGNAAAGAISLVSSNAPGVDTVTNAAAFTNGIDVESDDAVKARFRLAVQARGGGTEAAIRSAVANLKVGMTCEVLQNQDLNGNTVPGLNSVIVDDGSGALSDDLLAAAQAAVNDVRAAGVRTGVYAAVQQQVDIIMQIATAPGYDHNVAIAQVVAAIGLAVNATDQGAGLPYFSLIPVALSIAGVTSVLSYSLNNGTAGIPGSAQTTIKVGEIEVS